MSVYRPEKSKYYHYDFQLKGRRFHGSTGSTSKARAIAYEARQRNLAIEGKLDDACQMTLDDAAERWWNEKGQYLRSANDRLRQIGVVVRLLGPLTPLADIDTKRVAKAIQTRRKMPYSRGGQRTGAPTLPSNATVNRDMIDALRPILRRARRAWGASALPEIDWAELRLEEPKPKPKEFTAEEFERLLKAVKPYWHDLIRFAATYGMRIGEMFFPLSALDVADPENARVLLRNRKAGDDHILPLMKDDAIFLSRRAEAAKKAGLDTVWFREMRNGVKRPLSYNAAVSRLSKAMTVTGLREAKGMRGSHDLRRHSAMQMLRATGNLRVAQRLLGHASIQSTLAYAHATESDLRIGLEAVSRNSPGAAHSGK